MLEKLYIEEEHTEDYGVVWSLSFGKPAFQGGDTIVIDEKTAKELMKLKEFYKKD